jgi:hypothetical protein
VTQKVRHTLHLPQRLSRKLIHAPAPGVTQSSLVEAALAQFFDPSPTLQSVLVRRLDAMSRAQARIARHIDLLIEAQGLFIHSYYNATPPLLGSDQAAQKALGAKRFEGFLSELGRRLAKGASLASAVLEEAPPTGGVGATDSLAANDAATPSALPDRLDRAETHHAA